MSDTETPEQWADRICRHCRAYWPNAESARRPLGKEDDVIVFQIVTATALLMCAALLIFGFVWAVSKDPTED